jgi:uncharacterized protein GlcG (DUF336 family)
MTISKILSLIVIVLLLPFTAVAQDSEGLVTFKMLKPELALKIAQVALESCRESGFQVAVAVVDRMGVTQVILRDQLAGAHTPETARRKAWTAVSFRTDTLAMSDVTQAGNPQAGARFVDQALMIGGGVPVESGGSMVGGVGVAGAPDGAADDRCARDGIEAAMEELEF